MKITPRLVINDASSGLCLKTVDIDQFKLNTPTVISIDGSTTCTGISFLNLQYNALMGTMALERESGETPIQYKLRFKELMLKLLRRLTVTYIGYEDPFTNGNDTTNKVLFTLRTAVEELKEEYKPEFDNSVLIYINNMHWKKIFLDGKVPNSTPLAKKAIKEKVLSVLPFMSVCTQDEMDATGMGFSMLQKINDGRTDDIRVQKKVKPFKYVAEFIGADDDSEFFDEFIEMKSEFKIPSRVLDGDMAMYQIDGRGIFDNHVYKCMGEEDRLIVVKFKSTTHANVILENRLSDLVHSNKYIYAIIWRKSRKKQ